MYDVYGQAESIALDLFKADDSLWGIDKTQLPTIKALNIHRWGVEVSVTYLNGAAIKGMSVPMEKIYKVSLRKGHQLIVP